ncbi:MAG: hypothetical protein ACD_46C00147G0001 [uncultured bacterium]|nr:MAG: hypothetical protein ACD_46C00147G0001 [uncultured bacterium]
MINTVFNELAILLVLSVVFGLLAIKIRQPLILSYILVGVIAGPSFLGWITPHSEIEVLASFGVTLLLFIVGLRLDLGLIKTFGRVTVIIGLGQIVLTTFVGFILGIMMQIPLSQAFFISVALTFSSTIIIIKVLSDRYELDSLYGRISVGILIVQDLVVIIAIMLMSSHGLHRIISAQIINDLFSLTLRGMGFLAVIGIFMRFILPFFIEQFASSRELLILFALSWAVMLAVVAEYLGFGKEVGGFLAGVSLTTTHYREAIASRLETVRNVLLLFFFLNLGAMLHVVALEKLILPAIVFSIFVLVIKPIIVMVLMGQMRFRKRTGFLTGLTMGQLSEFSLILAALGVNLGYLDDTLQSLITFVAMISIGVSTYLMAYASKIYEWISPWLNYFEHRVYYQEDTYTSDGDASIDIIIYGLGRHGDYLANLLSSQGFRILGVDFDPRKVRATTHPNINIRYGDAEDAEFQKTLPFINAKWIVSTIPHSETNRMLVASLRELRFPGKIALSAYQESEIEMLKKLNVDAVFVPYREAAHSAAEYLATDMRV